MSSDGYIYIRNWAKYQHGGGGLPWHKTYNSLLSDDAYLELSLADRGTLHGLMTLASIAGDGRVSSSRTYLGRRLNVRRVSLESLIQAGWIEIRLDKASKDPSAELEVEKEVEVEEKNHVNPKQDRQARGHVWSAYEAHHPDAHLTADRKRLIDTRLGQGYTEQQLVDAIEGNHRDPYCNGENTSGKQYHALELILRNADKIEQYASVPATKASNGSPRPERVIVPLEHIRTEELIKRGVPKA